MTLKFPKCAVVGCGNWGGNLVRALASLDALGGIVEKNETRALELSKEYHIPVFEFEEVLKNPDIKGIFIATTSSDRGFLVEKAFLHKKHVFLEKPVALTFQEAQDLYVSAMKEDCHIMAGHLLLYHPVFQKMRDMVHSKDLGNIYCIKTARKNFGKFFKQESVLWDLGPHDLSMILALLPESISKFPTHYEKQTLHARDGVEDESETTLLFERIKVQMSLSRLSPYKEQRVTVLGEKGILTFDDTKPWKEKLLYTPLFWDGEDSSKTPVRGDDIFINIPHQEPLKNECLAFLEILEGKKDSQTFLDAMEVVKILEVLQAV